MSLSKTASKRKSDAKARMLEEPTAEERVLRDAILSELRRLDFGKMELRRCADVLGLEWFAKEWDVTNPTVAHLFIVAHELWQPEHMSEFSNTLKPYPAHVRDRGVIGSLLKYMIDKDMADGVTLSANGLQSGLIAANHGLVPYHKKYLWADDADQWAAVLKAGALLTTLPSQTTPEAFQAVVTSMQKLGIKGLQTGGLRRRPPLPQLHGGHQEAAARALFVEGHEAAGHLPARRSDQGGVEHADRTVVAQVH